MTSRESMFELQNPRPTEHGYSDLVNRFRDLTVAIVGLGGTGSYVLDLVSKTEVLEIHLYDGDQFIDPNAFRAPGVFTLSEVASSPFKVDLYRDRYSRFRRGIVAHPHDLTEARVEELTGFSVVFLCISSQPVKEAVFSSCPLVIDCGISARRVGSGGLRGGLRVTTGRGNFTPALRKHVTLRPSPDSEYFNAQIAELNAMNAALAVIKWKKHLGFFHDEHPDQFDSTYILRSNLLVST